ncbi:MAG: hypothetical protein WCA91_01250, partial [Candidatus Acidiferrales bacterium]
SKYFRGCKETISFHIATTGVRMWKPRRDNGRNMNSENKGVASQHMTTGLAAYEEALKDFSASATEFLKYIRLLTKARDAYQRAIKASTQLREILDGGDETVRNFMTQIQEAVTFQTGDTSPDERKPEAVKIETIKASWEKADAARA